MTARKARITRRSNVVYVYLEDPSIPSNLLGPKGNFLMAVYGPGSVRDHYEAAIRGYGDQGSVVRDRMLAAADLIARKHQVGDELGPIEETKVGRFEI